MRTVIDGRGCNTAPGSTGLTVEGDLIVGDVDVVKALRGVSASMTSKEVDTSGKEALSLTKDFAQKLIDLEKGFKKTLIETQEEVEAARKDLKAIQKENEKLTDRVKSLEVDFKKFSKAASKKDTEESL